MFKKSKICKAEKCSTSWHTLPSKQQNVVKSKHGNKEINLEGQWCTACPSLSTHNANRNAVFGQVLCELHFALSCTLSFDRQLCVEYSHIK